MSDFELGSGADHLAGHKESNKNKLLKKNINIERNTIVWHKLHPEGFKLPCIEGHSISAYGTNIFIFGGVIAGVRSSTVYSLSLLSQTSLSIVDCTYPALIDPLYPDKPPGNFYLPGRAYHACVQYNQYMCIHGGECHTNEGPAAVTGPSDNAPLRRDSSGAGGSNGGTSPSAGVCPGDSLAALTKYNKTFPKTQSQSNLLSSNRNNSNLNLTLAPGAAPGLRCLDDFYLFNVDTSVWIPVKSVLSPLPRKGHTLNIITLDDVKYFVLFGGFSSDSSLLSNSLHICAVEDAIAGRGAVWKHLDCCKGEAPTPRYFHSCSVVQNPGGKLGSKVHEALCVFGGVGAKSEILSDFYFLNLRTFQWTRIDPMMVPGPDNSAGQIIPKPLFGHTAVACADSSSIAVNPYAPPTEQNQKPKRLRFGNVLIFGGKTIRQRDPTGTSTGMGNGSGRNNEEPEVSFTSGGRAAAGTMRADTYTIDKDSNCSNFTYRFSFKDLSWSTTSSGYAVPQPRYGHAVCVVKGYTPIHNFPTTQAATKAMSRGGGGGGGGGGATNGLIMNADGILVPHTPAIPASKSGSASALSGAVTAAAANNTKANRDDNQDVNSPPASTVPTPMLFRHQKDVSCAVLVGGINSTMVPGDFWILDTKFRRAGMDQYDKNYYSNANIAKHGAVHQGHVPVEGAAVQLQQQQQQQQHARFSREVLLLHDQRKAAAMASEALFRENGCSNNMREQRLLQQLRSEEEEEVDDGIIEGHCLDGIHNHEHNNHQPHHNTKQHQQQQQQLRALKTSKSASNNAINITKSDNNKKSDDPTASGGGGGSDRPRGNNNNNNQQRHKEELFDHIDMPTRDISYSKSTPLLRQQRQQSQDSHQSPHVDGQVVGLGSAAPVLGSSSRAYADSVSALIPSAAGSSSGKQQQGVPSSIPTAGVNSRLPQQGERLVVGLPSASVCEVDDADDADDDRGVGVGELDLDPDLDPNALPAVTTIDGDGDLASNSGVCRLRSGGRALVSVIGVGSAGMSTNESANASTSAYTPSHTSSVADPMPPRLDLNYDSRDENENENEQGQQNFLLNNHDIGINGGHQNTQSNNRNHGYSNDSRVGQLIARLRKECCEYSKQLLAERHESRSMDAANETRIAELMDLVTTRDAELASSRAETEQYRAAYTALVDREKILSSQLEEAYSLLMLEKMAQQQQPFE